MNLCCECGWKGEDDELGYVPEYEDGYRMNQGNDVCPECGSTNIGEEEVNDGNV